MATSSYLALAEKWSAQNALKGLTTSISANPQMSDELLELQRALKDQPLALSQAAIYIREGSCSVLRLTKMVNIWRDSGLLIRLSEHYPDISEVILIVYKLCFDRVRRWNSRSADIVSLMSMLGAGGISELALLNQREPLRNFRAAVRMLQAFNLIQVSASIGYLTISLDPLVRTCIQVIIKFERKSSQWEGDAIIWLSERFPSGNFSYWKACDLLMPHVEHCLDHSLSNSDLFPLRRQYAKLLTSVAGFHEARGNFKLALEVLDKAVTVYSSSKPSEEDVHNIFDIEKQIVGVLTLCGDVKNGEARARVLQTKLKDFAEKSKEVRVSETRRLQAQLFSNTLAYIVHEQGQYEEAEKLYLEALNAQTTLYSTSHADYFNIKNNLARLYMDMGHYKQAERLHEEVLLEQTKQFGSTHHNTIYTMHCIASAIESSGRYAYAAEKAQIAHDLAEEILGSQHPDTLNMKNLLGCIRSKLGEYSAAEKLHREILRCRLEKYCEDHGGDEAASGDSPGVITSRLNLSVVLEKQNKYSEAAEELHLALSSASRLYGDGHPTTLKLKTTLGLIYLRQGQFTDAEALIRPLLEATISIYGENHYETLVIRNNLGGCLQRQCKWEKAIEEHHKTMTVALDPHVLGAEHPFTLRSTNNLAVALCEMAEAMHKTADPEKQEDAKKALQEAEVLHQRALLGREKNLGKEHPDTLTSVFNLGQVFHAQKRFDEAMERYRVALQGFSLRDPDFKSQAAKACKERFNELQEESKITSSSQGVS